MDDQPAEGHLRILNKNAFRSTDYYGVVLESFAKYIGRGNTSFNRVAELIGVPLWNTVPRRNQFVEKTGEETTLI
ncbi:MAG: hypothetical protein M5R36_26690 [Deltaproteobacteria bacterium]|nr:hypothetical protein [Deltaproteobacteria bacterium]